MLIYVTFVSLLVIVQVCKHMDCILQKGDHFLDSRNNYRYLGMEDLLQEFFLENSAINIEFLDNRTAEITAGKCLVSITEIVSDCQLIDTEALLILKKHILRLL